MTPGKKITRREFESEVLQFMARVDEHMSNQTKTCEEHARKAKEVSDNVTSLLNSREQVKGWFKAVGAGLPAVGSIAWFFYEFGSTIRKLKGGG